MTDRKKEAMFAKLAQQHAKAIPEDAAVAVQTPVEDIPPSPALPDVVKPKPSTGRRQAEPPSGKRSNPDFCQANAYVPKSLRKAVDRALLDIDGLDYSSLVAELLRKWLKARGVSE